VREADLLLHVVDISHPSFEHHLESVYAILKEIKSADKPTILVFNKIDAYEPEKIDEDDLVTERTKAHYTLEDWKKTWMAKLQGDVVFSSATDKENLDEFREIVYRKVKEIHVTRFPYNDFLFDYYHEEE